MNYTRIITWIAFLVLVSATVLATLTAATADAEAVNSYPDGAAYFLTALKYQITCAFLGIVTGIMGAVLFRQENS